jgi:hypothetical protein
MERSMLQWREEPINGLRWVDDPGHAWLEVDYTQHPSALEYRGLIHTSKGVIYLEEDCLAPAFLKANPHIVWRNLPTYSYDTSVTWLKNLPLNDVGVAV